MIGYYVHHHGRGHATRALEIARRLPGPVTGFGSLPSPPGWPGPWHVLPDDVPHLPLDPTAGGVVHWAPLAHPGHRDRFAILARHLGGEVDTLVVDVSCEVALFARIMGVRTAVVALRGDRADRPHRAAYDSAGVLIAPWTEETPEPGWSAEWTRKAAFVGPMSRFDAEPTPRSPAPRGGARRVLVMWGGGGCSVTPEDLAAAEAATPGWQWTVRTPASPSPDLWRELHEADVVVTHAGDSAVGEVAAAGRPAVVVAQPRPFGEQHATVRALRRAGACTAREEWPQPAEWAGLLDGADRAGGGGWRQWYRGDGAERAATAIRSLAGGAGP